jgi:hypothetical protein
MHNAGRLHMARGWCKASSHSAKTCMHLWATLVLDPDTGHGSLGHELTARKRVSAPSRLGLGMQVHAHGFHSWLISPDFSVATVVSSYKSPREFDSSPLQITSVQHHEVRHICSPSLCSSCICCSHPYQDAPWTCQTGLVHCVSVKF